MIRSLLPTIALALCLAAPAALAGPAEHTPENRGENVAEAIAKVRAKAAKRDANGDGWLSAVETAGGRDKLGALYGAIERKVDANGDGRISVDEYVDAQVQALHAADTNGDGWISPGESREHKRRLVMEMLGRR